VHGWIGEMTSPCSIGSQYPQGKSPAGAAAFAGLGGALAVGLAP
jgi:hypothetical protein